MIATNFCFALSELLDDIWKSITGDGHNGASVLCSVGAQSQMHPFFGLKVVTEGSGFLP